MANSESLVGPVSSDVSGLVVSKPAKGVRTVIEILDVVKAFSSQFYIYVMIILTLVTVMLSHQIPLEHSLRTYWFAYFKRIQINT